MKPVIAVIGGFLGAGKTSLILAAAGVLERKGLHVAVVLNDQGDDLVDTHLVQSVVSPPTRSPAGASAAASPI